MRHIGLNGFILRILEVDFVTSAPELEDHMNWEN